MADYGEHSSTHVHAADEPLADRHEAAKLPKDLAEKIIAAATSRA